MSPSPYLAVDLSFLLIRRFSSEKLISLTEDVVCCAVVVSAVDVKALSRNVLNVIVQVCG
jgi:hypothetical protein